MWSLVMFRLSKRLIISKLTWDVCIRSYLRSWPQVLLSSAGSCNQWRKLNACCGPVWAQESTRGVRFPLNRRFYAENGTIFHFETISRLVKICRFGQNGGGFWHLPKPRIETECSPCPRGEWWIFGASAPPAPLVGRGRASRPLPTRRLTVQERRWLKNFFFLFFFLLIYDRLQLKKKISVQHLWDSLIL